MPLYSRQDLADHCLRTLGAPVLNIEIDDDQLADAIETAVNFYHDYHPDGIERDYVKHKFVFTTLTLNDASLINIGNVVRTLTTYAQVYDKVDNTITISVMTGPVQFVVGDTITFDAGSATITSMTVGDPDNGWIPIDENIQGIIRIMPWVPSFGDGMFDITYQLRMNDLRNLSSGTLNYFVSTMEYLSTIDFVLRKEKQFRFNRRMNRLYIDQAWKSDIAYGTFAIVECYRTLDDNQFPEMFNDPWLKKYAAALVKRYWGANLRKYVDVALPGGIKLDGREIYSEAGAEIEMLEQDMINNQAPLSFQMG